MSDLDRNTLWARAFMDELARAGVRELCVAPGSRSTPLVLAAVANGSLRMHVHIDERSAAFFALGVGRQTGRPAAVLTTSGTAVANLLPAVVEASQSEVPLLVLTADRPHRLRDADANQAIDQVRIFGGSVREFFEVAPPVVGGPELRHLRTVASRAVAAAVGRPGGPVHLNLPFDKPLEPTPGTGDVPAGFADAHGRAFRGRADGSPYVRVAPALARAGEDDVARLAHLLETAARPVLVAGPVPDPDRLGAAAVALAARAGVPLLADALSGARYGAGAAGATGAPGAAAVTAAPAAITAPGAPPLIGAYDAILGSPALAAALAPDLVIRVGRSPTSAHLLAWLEGCTECPHVVIDGGRRWKDHLAVATDYVPADAADTLERMAARVDRRRVPRPWTERWAALEAAAREALTARTSAAFFEGAAVAEAVRAIPFGGTLFVSSSMPVRDVDAFVPARDGALRVLGNRGASGIDGVLSTALGASVAGARPMVAIVGDLAFLHDSNGLLAAREEGAEVVFVVIQNDGGGIFHFLPVRAHEPAFTPYFATPHGLDLSHLAALHRLPHVRADSALAVRAAVEQALAAGGTHVIEVPSDREDNRRLRAQALAAVRAALEAMTTEESRG